LLEQAPRRPAPPTDRQRAGADPRAALAAAAAVTVGSSSVTTGVLGAVTVWLAAAAFFARHGDRGVLKIGLVLSAVLGVGLLVAR